LKQLEGQLAAIVFSWCSSYTLWKIEVGSFTPSPYGTL